MSFAALPLSAAWRHCEARVGFEVAYFAAAADGWRIEGRTTAREGDEIWDVDYAIRVDGTWATRWARVVTRSALGSRATEVVADGAGGWLVDGVAAPHLDGCRDVDLEASAMTNALPVHRMALAIGAAADAPAAYVRVGDATVERLEQTYARQRSDAPGHRYRYTCPRFEVDSTLSYDPAGLVLDYPGIAVRAG